MSATITKLVPKPSARTKYVTFLLVDGEKTKIPVSFDLSARLHELFYRELPSDLQKRRLAALRRLMAAAYKAGQSSK